MDRVNGAGTIDIGSGRRGFRDEDLTAGQEGTQVPALWLNMVQEEITKVIEDAGLVLDPADWTQLSQALARQYSRLVPPPVTTFYVVGATGNDNNSGLASTPQDGFATIAGAISALNSRYSTSARITLHVAAGTYGGFSPEAGNIRKWLIIGAGVGSTVVDASTTAVNGGRAMLVDGADVIVQGIKWRAIFECVGVSPQGGVLEISGVNSFEMLGPSSYGINAAGGQISLFGNVIFSGFGIAGIAATRGAIRLGYADGVLTRAVALEWAAGATVSTANIAASDGGSVLAFPSAVFQDGLPTGKKYDARLNGTINTQGSGVNFFAGTLAGSSATGGQYI